MESEQNMMSDIAPTNPIRVETALSRRPIHRLAKHGNVIINIYEKSEDGETLIQWEVSHNSKYGQPGPLAYKLDTLIINRRVEEISRPVPRIVKIGSLSDICRELGLVESGKSKKNIKNALYQNAFTAINAKTTYRQSDGKERSIEFADTRYGVVFTGETLPNGCVADAVYIVLHDFYREILDNAITRPLDYDYLRDLPPAPQRLYELLSYQIYAALKHDRARAKLVYSDFCTNAPQTRYLTFDQVKKQMYKVHNMHIRSGYISKVNFDQTTDAEGNPDWIMFYQPGMKARAEYRTFTKRGNSPTLQIEQASTETDSLAPVHKQLDLKLTSPRKSRSKAKPQPVQSPLIAELIQIGVTGEIAGNLVEQFPERIQLQIEYLEWEIGKKPGKIADPAAYLVKAIERNNAPPKGFVSKAEHDRQAEAKRQAEQAAAAERRRQQETDQQERNLARQAKAFRQSRTPEQLARLEADAIAAASEDTRHNLSDPAMKPFRRTLVSSLVNEHIVHMIQTGQLTIEPA